jgi:hypothetical protein
MVLHSRKTKKRMRLFYSSLIVLGCLPSLHAQLVSVGVKAGVPVTDVVEGNVGVHSEARPYTVGPMVQLRLPFSFAVEVDALYKRTGYSSFAATTGAAGTALRVRANSWEFPMLLKYYLPGYESRVRPYAEVGYVPRRISGVQANFSNLATGVTDTLNSASVLREDLTHGVAVGGGLEVRAGRLRVAPEVRYTHWGEQPFREILSRNALVRSVDNQFEFLLGIRF